MDRFDCQLLMATFSNVYYHTFCRSAMNVVTVLLLHLIDCSLLGWSQSTPCMFLPMRRGPNPNQVWHSILLLTTEEQLDVFSRLQESLTLRGSI